ncbi:PAS domain S-box-containing protein [Thermanaeromonas toyohensis ToBE]|uniref:PAS domain S-box-containing protein n=1 Tax=Thermanaeromonas toyohensis ToBE TaxID=698762 RepID=A0A1W1W0S3_9FIRM|nr:sigma 54-interacting transcriptional regulator [Thermanaeromonas toyohensis]SMB99217.1 PAS domain S-box-containing protein [Thermanaeromonas toyohensis ToBE]
MPIPQSFLKLLWETLEDPVLLTDSSLQVINTNPAARNFLGASVIGSSLSELFGKVPFWVELVGLLERGGQKEGEISIGDRDFLCRAVTLKKGGMNEGLLLLLREITELRRMTKKLELTERWRNILYTILDTAYEGIVVVDENGYITMFNQAYADFLGVRPEEMIGKHVQEVIENTRMHIVIKTGKPEFRQVQRIKGHNMICDRIPIWEGDKIIGAVGKVLFRDISEVDELAEQVRRLKKELEYYKGQLRRHYQQARYSLEDIIGQSRVIRELKEMVNKVASTSSTVLLKGESGTGKELFAHAIHNASPRYRGPFIKVNCAAIPENLLESELFGYEEGAFTGAKKGGKPGKFELANGGTIFLDEIGDMPLNMQAKLLRVLQEKEIEHVGGNRPVKIDVRVIAATNRDLEALIREGRFRSDLFYRLNVVTFEIPPLRQRKEDIPLLVEHFLDKLGRTLGCGRKKITPAALEVLLQHNWPGNVRELENVLERALNVVDGPEILPHHLPPYLTETRTFNSRPLRPLKETLARVEKELLEEALRYTKGNCLLAAHLLGLSKSTFYEKVARYGLRESAFREYGN